MNKATHTLRRNILVMTNNLFDVPQLQNLSLNNFIKLALLTLIFYCLNPEEINLITLRSILTK